MLRAVSTVSWLSIQWRISGMIVLSTNIHKQNLCVCLCGGEVKQDVVKSDVDCFIHQSVWPMNKLQGVQQGASDVLQGAQYQFLGTGRWWCA